MESPQSEFVLIYWIESQDVTILEKKQSQIPLSKWKVGQECKLPFGREKKKNKKTPKYLARIVAINGKYNFNV